MRRVRLASAIAAARIVAVSPGVTATVGAPAPVTVDVDLGRVSPDEIAVELVVGRRSGHELRDITVVELTANTAVEGRPRRFACTFTAEAPGSFGYFVRVRPRGAVGLHDAAIWA